MELPFHLEDASIHPLLEGPSDLELWAYTMMLHSFEKRQEKVIQQRVINYH